jgi:hypothetical protein
VEAAAQMTTEYPTRFSLSGVVELSYTDYYYKLPSVRANSEYHMSFIHQTYGLGASGYILHPRLAVFNVDVSYNDDRQLAAVRGLKTNGHDLGYNLELTLLPYRPLSLTIYAGNTSETINEAPFGAQDRTTKYYGARLKIMKPFLPFMRLEYTHREDGQFGWGGLPTPIKTDEYTLDFRGNLNFLHTVYTGIVQYVDFSGGDIKYKTTNVQLNVYSILKEGISLQNSFNYSQIAFSKLLGFSSQLGINHSQTFNQYYGYNFYRSENILEGVPSQGIPGGTNKETINYITGSWTYRFVNGPSSSLSLNYGTRNESDGGTSQHAKFYGISFSLSYAKSFLGTNFNPDYRLIIRKDDLKGNLMENDIELNLVTRNLKWGILYSNYSLTVLHEKDISMPVLQNQVFDTGATFETHATEIDNIIHAFRTGIRGRGIGTKLSRAQWNLEAEVFYSNATIVRQIPESEETFDTSTAKTETIKQNINRYSLLGNVSYPIGWAAIFFNSGYSIGQSNSRSLKRFFYEERISYPVFRNFRLFVKWQQLWDKIADSPTQRVDEYSISAEYRVGQTTISADGTVLNTTVNGQGKLFGTRHGQEIKVRKFFLRFRRVLF